MNNITYDKRKSKTPIFILGLIIIFIIIISMCYFYVSKLKSSINHESNRYLTEVSEIISVDLKDRIESNFKRIQSTAISIERMNYSNIDDIIKFLKKDSNVYDAIRMGFSDLNGVCKTSDGHTIDISGEDYFKKAVKGENAISAIMPSKIDDNDVIIYAVPYYKDNKIQGIINAVYNKEKLRNLLNVNTFNGEGFCHIIDSSGNFIVHSNNKNSYQNSNNFFDIEKIGGTVLKGYSLNELMENIQNKKSGLFEFYLANLDRSLIYKPLNIDDWYLLSIVPTKVINTKTNDFVTSTIIISSVIVALFLALILLIIIMYKENTKKLEYIAFVDPVTNGGNNIRFDMEVRKLVRNSPPNTYVLVSFNIKNFKLVNDCFGSNRGDKVLKYIFETIEKNLVDGELVSRINADIFNILLKYNSKEEVLDRLKKIVESINKFNDVLDNKYFLSFSQGIYIIDNPNLDIVSIRDRASVARKNTNKSILGLSSYMFYTDIERLRMIKEKEIENKMEKALANNEFVVYLQPKYEIKNNTICGAEALVRWIDPEKGLLSPGHFIPVFEKNGFIVKLDLYVFENVCKTLRRWIDKGIKPVPISLNLSQIHLKNPNFLDEYIKIYELYNIPSELIEIELTETLVFENMDILINVINEIHTAGFKCSLDDFGSGYSSLNMLKDIPVDSLKLDKAFFETNNSENTKCEYVIESIIDLAKKLEMQTVSEGVETIPQVEFLKKSSCDIVQGYVFSKPIPIKDFENLTYGKEVEE